MKDVTKQLRDQRKAQIVDRRAEFETGSLSTVLRIALEDLEATERLPGYVIDLQVYHDPDTDEHPGKCVVCLAGSVMARTLGIKPDVVSGPNRHAKPIRDRIHAIDWARLGGFAFAAIELGYSDNDVHKIYTLTGGDWADLTEYEDDPVQFKADMRAHIATLVKAGF